jgi:hypothetical protein
MQINLKISVYELPWVLTQKHLIFQRVIEEGVVAPEDLNRIEIKAEKVFKADCCQLDESGKFVEDAVLISATGNSEAEAINKCVSRMVEHLQIKEP